MLLSTVKALLLVILLAPAAVYASDGKQQTVELKPLKIFSKASGRAVITDVRGNRKKISIRAEGLVPNGTYSAFLARDRPPQETVEIGPAEFKADARGRAAIETFVDGGQFVYWDAIDILYQKDGKIAGTGGKEIFIVLKGLLLEKPDFGSSAR